MMLQNLIPSHSNDLIVLQREMTRFYKLKSFVSLLVLLRVSKANFCFWKALYLKLTMAEASDVIN
jgi:hypothetical protein